MSDYDADVIDEWERAGASRSRRARIHPSGGISDETYEQSGEIAADRLAHVFALAGLPVLAARIVDYGCGDGRVALPLADRYGVWVYGFDASPAMLAAFRARRRLGMDLGAVTVDPEELPDYAPFDGAYCLAVLIHQRWEQAARIVQAIAELLRPGGAAVLDLPCYEDEEEGGSPFAVTTFAPERIAWMVSGAGLEVVAAPLVNPGRFAGKPGPYHGSLTVAVRA